MEGISSDLVAKTKGIDLELGKISEDWTVSIDARYLTYWDSDYPEHLKTIYDPPIGIFVLC